MKIKVNKQRFEIAKSAQKNILANAMYHEILLLKAKHQGDDKAIEQLTQICEDLCLVSELLDAELTKLQAIYQVNLN